MAFGVVNGEFGLELPPGIREDALEGPAAVFADEGCGEADDEDEVGIGGRRDKLRLAPALTAAYRES
jgi:hypothetical protein